MKKTTWLLALVLVRSNASYAQLCWDGAVGTNALYLTGAYTYTGATTLHGSAILSIGDGGIITFTAAQNYDGDTNLIDGGPLILASSASLRPVKPLPSRTPAWRTWSPSNWASAQPC